MGVCFLSSAHANDPPVANDDNFSLSAYGSISQGPPGVIDNDSDPDGDGLTAYLVSGPGYGSLTFNGDGSFDYSTWTANALDSFTYYVSDGTNDSNTATVYITIGSVNSPPVANDDSYSVSAYGSISQSVPGVIDNDSDPEGDSLTAYLATGPSYGTLTFNSDGSFSYSTWSASVDDAFTYYVSDGINTSNVATVLLSVAAYYPPIANDDNYSVVANGSITENAPGVIGNDDGSNLSATLVSGPSYGTLTFNSDGSFSYSTWAASVDDVFTYYVSDGINTSNVATVLLSVAAYYPPIANDDNYSVVANGSITENAPGVIGNDDGNNLSATLVSGPNYGSLTFSSDGSFSYSTWAASTTDSFAYYVSDGSNDSNTATVYLSIAGVNNAPSANDDTFVLSEFGSVAAGNSGAMRNDSDPEGDPLTAYLNSGPTNGSLTFNSDGSFTYSTNLAAGTDSFTYYVSDGANNSNLATVYLNVVSMHTLVVDTTGDVEDGDVSSVANLLANRGSDGRISLREAIKATNNTANGSGGKDMITFNIAGAGPHSIALSSALPDITDTVVIDGTTQPGFSSAPIIELNGTSAGVGVTGLTLGPGSSGSTIRGLVINRFTSSGIQINGNSNTITGNFIGTNVAGTAASANAAIGVLVRSYGNTITGNVISGNGADGVRTHGVLPEAVGRWSGENSAADAVGPNHGTLVNGTTYGAGLSGQAFSLDGVDDYVQIGDHTTLKPRMISVEAWVNPTTLTAGNSHVVVSKGNSGSGPLANSRHSYLLGFVDDSLVFETTHVDGTAVNLYGGTVSTGTWHHVVGSYDGTVVRLYLDGVEVASQAVTSPLQYDAGVPLFLGTDFDNGSVTNANFHGLIDEAQLYDHALTAKQISQIYAANGPQIDFAGSDNLITSNRIGTNAAGTAAIGNAQAGIALAAGRNNVILGNSIDGNGSLGIDLSADGVTTNDSGDSDSGPNDLQNFPVLAAAVSNGANTTITGTFNSNASTTYRIEVFSSPGGDPSGYGEGQRYLGAATVTTDGSGNAAINATLTGVTLTNGHKISATATVDLGSGNYGNTSEFSAHIAATVISVAFDATASSGAESIAAVTIPVSLSSASGQNVTVDFAVTGGTATGGGGDYTLAGGTLTFTPGQTSKNIPITVVNDALDEPDETIQITLFNASNAGLGANAVHTFTIVDDDPPPSVAFDVISSSGAESVTPANLSVSLSVASGKLVTVDYAVTGSTATGAGVDYTLMSGALIFSAGQTSKTIPLAIIDDALDEANETIQVALSNPSNATLGANTTHTYTIIDNDPPPSVAFETTASSGLESLASGNIPVSLSVVSGQTAMVDFSVTAGTANGSGVDYTLATGTLTFTPGTTSQNISLAIVNDTLNEASESIQITLSNPLNATLGANAEHIYTILDNDATPTVAFNAPTSSGAESVTSFNIPVSISAASGLTVTVDYAVTGGTASGGVDYTLVSGTLTFAAGQTSRNIPLTVINDALNETNETIQTTLSNPLNATLGANRVHTYTILDDDATPNVAFNASSSSGAESATAVSIPVSLSAASGQTVSVNYAVTGGTASGGGVDYTLASGALTFAAGVTTQNIGIAVVNDALNEANETIQITLSNSSNAALGANTVHTYTILDDDAAPTVTLSIAGASMPEAGGMATVAATLSVPSGQDVTVTLGFSGTATFSTDYTASASSITISAGSTTGVATLTAIQDTIGEPNETIVVDVTSVANGSTSTPQQVAVTIVDDDTTPTVTLSIANESMAEAGGVATVTATLSAVSSQDVTINLNFSGTATLSTDYTASAAAILIPAGNLTGAITLTAIQDTLSEANETIVVTIGSITNAAELGMQPATATIIDDDVMPTVSLSLSGSQMTEAGGTVTVTATLSGFSGQAVTVGLGFSGTATLNVDYTASSTSIIVPAGSLSSSITLTAIHDSIDEPNETIIATIGLVANAMAAGVQQVTVTIIDDDGPNVALNLAIADTPDPVQPGSQLTYTLTYGNATTANQTASQVTLNNTLAANTTFVSASNGGMFAAGVVTWSLGDLAPGASGTLTLVVQVNTPLADGTVLIDQATLQDNASASVSTSQTTAVQSAAILALTVTDVPDPVPAGSQITYTLTYGNAAAASQIAAAATLRSILPANTAFVSASNGGTLSGGVVAWNLGDLAPGASGMRTLVVQVDSPLADGTVLSAQASLQDALGNSASASQATTVQSAALLRLKVTGSPDAIPAGGQITYTLTVSNASAANQAVSSSTLTDTLASSVTFVSASDGGALGNGIVTWILGSLAPGMSVTRTLIVKLNSGIASGSLISNTATVSDGQGQSAAAQSNTTVRFGGGGGIIAGSNSLSIVEPTPRPPSPSQNPSLGGAGARGIAPALGSPGLPPASAERISETAHGSRSEQAANPQSASVNKSRCSSILSLTGSHSPQPVFVGGEVVYLFNYINVSASETIRDVALHSVLPKEMTFASAGGRGIAAEDNSIYWHLGDLPPGARGSRSVAARVGQLGGELMLRTHNHAILEDGVNNCAQHIEAVTIQAMSLSDKDNDGFPDEDEKRCGANPLDASSTCYSLELVQSNIRVPRGSEVSLQALVKGKFRFVGEVAITPHNSLTGAIWRFADANANIGPKKMSESVSFGLHTTNNTPLGLYHIPIWAVSGKMTTTQILTVEVVP